MKALDAVLRKVVVQQFYTRNAGFFLVVFFLMFGVQQPASFLISPMFLSGVAASPMFTLLVLGVFFLYYLKCLQFLLKVLQAPENEFLYLASLLPEKELRFSWAKAYLGVFLPAVAYTGWLGIVGVYTGSYWAMLLVLVFQVGLLLVTVKLLQKKLSGYRVPQRGKPWLKLPSWPWPPFLWPLRFFLHQEPVMLLLTKLLAVAVLLGFMHLYPYPEFDLRPTQVGFLIAATAHAMLVQRVQEFQEAELKVIRQLPFTSAARILQQALLFGVLLLPEFFFLFRFAGHWETLWPLGQLCLFGVGYLLLLLTLLYRPGSAQETYLQQVFFLFMGLLLGFLLSPPLWLVALLFLAFSFLRYRRWYYQYERVISQNGPGEA
ncbi:hypothetical protein [Rufibacter quisquiliarum]|uniref:Uncharacterized protein n=1 Tax=Rufibacter quisquiliarum TaxID=1549639 RepID=A0A839GEY7_9BACT|nr:hypothetical protein [Rufibacter quisquiliarum]MBA9078184.1 hypothetical protein [Rufibacter quisquiliarum]